MAHLWRPLPTTMSSTIDLNDEYVFIYVHVTYFYHNHEDRPIQQQHMSSSRLFSYHNFSLMDPMHVFVLVGQYYHQTDDILLALASWSSRVHEKPAQYDLCDLFQPPLRRWRVSCLGKYLQL